MKEKEPTQEPDLIDPETERWMRGAARNAAKNKLSQIGGKIVIGASYIFYSLLTEKGRNNLRNPEYRRFFLESEASTGLLANSIFAPELYYPNETSNSLEHQSAQAGRWIGYDFNRQFVFGKNVVPHSRQIKKGRLISFPLEEIINNQFNQLTPTSFLSIYRLDHMFLVDTPSINDLTDCGFIEEVTYEQAYQEVGLYEKFRTFLKLKSLNDKTLYRITPKGNGLVFIDEDSGTKKTEPEKSKVLKQVFDRGSI